jgi:hypothetical protein
MRVLPSGMLCNFTGTNVLKKPETYIFSVKDAPNKCVPRDGLKVSGVIAHNSIGGMGLQGTEKWCCVSRFIIYHKQ